MLARRFITYGWSTSSISKQESNGEIQGGFARCRKLRNRDQRLNPIRLVISKRLVNFASLKSQSVTSKYPKATDQINAGRAASRGKEKESAKAHTPIYLTYTINYPTEGRRHMTST